MLLFVMVSTCSIPVSDLIKSYFFLFSCLNTNCLTTHPPTTTTTLNFLFRFSFCSLSTSFLHLVSPFNLSYRPYVSRSVNVCLHSFSQLVKIFHSFQTFFVTAAIFFSFYLSFFFSSLSFYVCLSVPTAC
jgi:hypothetical protein